MIDQREVRLTGTGGQGVILGSIILAEAALNEDNYAVQSQSYGPEARGGMCKAEVIMAHQEIDYPKVENPDILLALSQQSVDKYCREASDRCVVIVDSSLNVPCSCAKTYKVPILETAYEKLRNPITANVVALGVLNQIVRLVNHESLEKAVLKYVPSSAKDINKTALIEGERIAQAAIM